MPPVTATSEAVKPVTAEEKLKEKGIGSAPVVPPLGEMASDGLPAVGAVKTPRP